MRKNSEARECSLTISVELDEVTARQVMEAIGVELVDGRETEPRTELKIDYRKSTLYLTIHTRDLSSLRASLNSYVRWLNLAIESARLSTKQFPSGGEEQGAKDNEQAQNTE
ncbi:MAG: KEOPS complex subunit Pcc1 [Thermoplasmata archaeon]|nr:KEOPS complex subunit Pcc1 [Thermoplasmata archaeon]